MHKASPCNSEKAIKIFLPKSNKIFTDGLIDQIDRESCKVIFLKEEKKQGRQFNVHLLNFNSKLICASWCTPNWVGKGSLRKW